MVELARREDVERMLAISNASAAVHFANFATGPEPLQAWLDTYDSDHRQYPWLVTDGGFAKAGPHKLRGAYAWSADVSVYVSAPRRGLGRALYAALIDTMRAQGFVNLIAGIALPNPGSVGLHEAFGFRHCGTFSKIGFKQGDWRDVGYWELRVNDATVPPPPLRPVAECFRGASTR